MLCKGLGSHLWCLWCLKAILCALVCEVVPVPFIDSYFLREFIQISSTYPLFPFSLISMSPGVVRQLVRDIDVGPVLSRGVEKIAATSTFEMCTVPLPLSLLHKVKINKNWNPPTSSLWNCLAMWTRGCSWSLPLFCFACLCGVLASEGTVPPAGSPPLSSQVPSPCMQPCCPWQKCRSETAVIQSV